MKPILFLAFLLLMAISVCGQSAPAPACTLKLSQAPVVRGVKLGTTVDQLFPLFSNGSETSARIKQTLSAAEGYPNFGYAFFALDLSEAANQEQFAGVNRVSVSTFDHRIVSLSVQYDRFPKGARWQDTDDLV